MAERANVSEVSDSLYRHKKEFIDSMTGILKLRTDEINNSLRTLCLTEEPDSPQTSDCIKS